MAKISVKKKIEKLVFLENNEPLTTSLRIVEELRTRTPKDEREIEHKAVMQLIRKYQSEFSEFGFPHFECEKNRGTQGRQTEFAILNEGQTLFLFTLMRNSTAVVEVKKNLVKEFFRLRKTVAKLQAQQANEAWVEMRKSGKVERRLETDTIQDFIYYATSQGSKNAHTYYKNITKMQNKALFIIEQEFPNLREVLSGRQLGILKSVDLAVMYALKDGMEQGLDYHDIYKLAKNHVETMMRLFPRTVVPERVSDTLTLPCTAVNAL